jgi:flagellar basal-body rod protein FlgC
MGFENLFSAGAISGSGMSAERLRMEVIANNIANAQSTKSANGGPFRRQEVVFAEVLGGHSVKGGLPNLRGVQATEIIEDMSDLRREYMPGHPEADAEGFVTMPNVQLAMEMVNLLTATRAYEANLKAAQAFKQLGEQALLLIRS